MHFLKDRGYGHRLASEVTPQGLYLARRQWLQTLATSAAALTLPATAQTARTARPGKHAVLPSVRSGIAGALTMDRITPYADASSYNNYYEFGTDKSDPCARRRHAETAAVDSARRR